MKKIKSTLTEKKYRIKKQGLNAIEQTVLTTLKNKLQGATWLKSDLDLKHIVESVEGNSQSSNEGEIED